MNRESIVRFLQELEGPNVNLTHQDEWVSTHCPLRHYTHTRGTDRTPSFGIHVEDNGRSIFNCFTCKKKGPLPYLVQLLGRFTGEDYNALYEEATNGEILAMRLPKWNETGVKRGQFELPSPMDFDLYDLYEPEYRHWYLRDRGVLPETAEELKLRIDPDDGHGVERVLFPVFDFSGGFYGYTGRATDGSVDPRVRDYYGLPKRHLLLGANHLHRDVDRIVLVEGLFDFAILFQLNLPVVAALHSQLTPHQQRLLVQMNKPVVVFFDDDAAGKKGTEEVVEALGEFLPLLGVKYPRRGQAGYRPKNDPGKLPDDVILRMYERAHLL
jgi:hypothetical protein